jgi:hypothetical protein
MSEDMDRDLNEEGWEEEERDCIATCTCNTSKWRENDATRENKQSMYRRKTGIMYEREGKGKHAQPRQY